MKRFSKLFDDIDQTNSTNEKSHLLAHYFRTAPPRDAIWGLYLFLGRRPKNLIGSRKLRKWFSEKIDFPEWLVDECYSAVGDTAEMISLLSAAGLTKTETPQTKKLEEASLAVWMEELILPLFDMDENEQKERVSSWWMALQQREVFIVNKFLTGALRAGVSEGLVFKALQDVIGLPRSVIAARLIGDWTPSVEFFESLKKVDLSGNTPQELEALPKAFCLAAPLSGDVSDLGPVEDWYAEWKWDGIRVQAVKFQGRIELWSRGEERVTESFPDLVERLQAIGGDWILDGELVAGAWNTPELFQELQKRLNRKKPAKKLMAENPVGFVAYDLLSMDGADLTQHPLSERRRQLEQLLKPYSALNMGVSKILSATSWDQLRELQKTARAEMAEGLMLKKKDAPYVSGRKRGIWFKWKVDPLTLDVVLTAAQPGSGKRASIYSDYTFSIWSEDQLVPIAKAYSGLTDEELRSVDSWIRKNTTDRFGPVRALKPEKVFEIAFEGVAESSRHKSGFAVRFPRILRERPDKPVREANSVGDVAVLLDRIRNKEL